MEIKKTLDGIEFVPFGYSAIVPYSSKEFFDCFEGNKLDHTKFINFLRRGYPKEKWDDFINLEWELRKEISDEKHKYYWEKNLEFSSYYPVDDIKLYQGIGKREKGPITIKPLHTEFFVVYAHKEPLMEHLPTGICIISGISLGLKESYKRLLSRILFKSYGPWEVNQIFYSVPVYKVIDEDRDTLSEWRIIPGFPSKVDEFLKVVRQVYNEEKFSRVDDLEEAIKALNKIGKDTKDLEEEMETLLQELDYL